jgi:hypothetical protein
MKKTIYISGKISGDINYQNKFEDAEALLAKAGYHAINPVKYVLPKDKDNWHDAMKTVLSVMLCCDGIALLPDWADSKGAKIEEGLAYELNIPVKSIEDWIKEKEKWT